MIQSLAPALMVLTGIGGLVFLALKFNREDASAAVVTGGLVLEQMQALNNELVEQNGRLRAANTEKDDLIGSLTRELRLSREAVERLEKEVRLLRDQVEELNGHGTDGPDGFEGGLPRG
jgi:hypothetical protein